MDRLVEQLQALKQSATLAPDSAWKEAAAVKLQARMRSTSPAVAEEQLGWSVRLAEKTSQALHIFLPHKMAGAMRPAFTAFMVSVMAVSGWIATVSASYSVPGDTLYSVKIAAEKTQVAVAAATGAEQWETELHLKFANERARETKDVISKNPTHASEQVNVAMKSLKESLQAVNEKIDAVTDGNSEKAAALAKDVNEKTNQIVATLGEVSKDPNTVETSVVKEVVETTRLVNDTGIKAIASAIEKQAADSATTDSAKQEMKDLVVEKINSLSADPVVTGNVPAIAPVVTSTLTTTVQQVQTDALKKETASTTLVVDPKKVEDVVQQVVQKVEQTAQGTAAAKGAIEQAKTFADNNQLTEAIQKVKEANAATQEVKKNVMDVHEAVKEILPVVQPQTDSAGAPLAPNVPAAVDSLLSVVTTTPATITLPKDLQTNSNSTNVRSTGN